MFPILLSSGKVRALAVVVCGHPGSLHGTDAVWFWLNNNPIENKIRRTSHIKYRGGFFVLYPDIQSLGGVAAAGQKKRIPKAVPFMARLQVRLPKIFLPMWGKS